MFSMRARNPPYMDTTKPWYFDTPFGKTEMNTKTENLPETRCRAVTFPFTPHSTDWKELDPLLHKCWAMSTRLANWSMCQLALADQLTLDHDAEKLGPMPNLYLYGLFNRVYPEREAWQGAKIQACSIFQAVMKKYAKARIDLWRGTCSLPSYRYPFPFPVHNQAWQAFYGPDNIPLVKVRLPGSSVILRLRGGPEMHRQLARFKDIVNGCKRAELAIYRSGKKPMIKLVAHFPICPDPGACNVMNLHTVSDALWVAEVPGMTPRIWNQDHIRTLVYFIERHKKWRQRISEDLKAEKRVPRRMRKHMDHAIEDRCRKQNNRLKTFCHEMTAQLVQLAVRQKVATVIYDDENKDYYGAQFPWADLKTKLSYKLDQAGIKLIKQTESAQFETSHA